MNELHDEIALLARHYLGSGAANGLSGVDREIELAMAEGEWDALGKWHRVKFRMLRMQREQTLVARMAGTPMSSRG